ncbi:hypothetical protein CYMTET_12065 [Cymbomonas tetramitiformis]|uniref:General transcription and DNA repair factor IIH subunit TFB5 n=1 Tax=Cymbomonas tetramitiformis TaxID=36881 RepID=A0AAE0LCF5_9CHLO|nr:hypothetical protein CYMTET_12065 [Cymbomonas tetramitiformis]
MVSAHKGILLECDIPTKQYLVSLNNDLEPSDKFIKYDLDDTHLFVQAGEKEEQFLKEALEKFHREVTFIAPQN